MEAWREVALRLVGIVVRSRERGVSMRLVLE